MITFNKLKLENELKVTKCKLENLKNNMDTKIHLMIEAQIEAKSYKDSISLNIEEYNDLLKNLNEIIKQLNNFEK